EQELHRRVPAQRLFDQVRQQRAVGAYARELGGVTKQRVGRVADQVGRRLVARDEQQHDEERELGIGEGGFAVLRRQQDADEVVAGRAAPLLGDFTDVA